MSHVVTRKIVSLQTLSLLIVALLLAGGLLHMQRASGDQLPTRSVKLAKASPGVSDDYTLTFTIPNAETLGSIRFQFCAESPLIGAPCTLPSGMNLAGLTLSSQTGVSDFTLQSSSGTNVILSRTPSTVGPITVSYVLSGIINPSNAGSYFGRIQTFASSDASGASTDYGGLALDISDNLQISATVPPYLYFCLGITIANTDCSTASGDYINFGDFTTAIASTAQTQMVAGTNADTGYTITANGLTLTSGNNIIPGLSVPDVSRPGTSQFGINLVANQDPQVGQNPSGNGFGAAAAGYNQANRYKFVPNDIIAGVSLPDEARKYTVSYVTNIAKDQPAGIYVSTFTYTCLAGF